MSPYPHSVRCLTLALRQLCFLFYRQNSNPTTSSPHASHFFITLFDFCFFTPASQSEILKILSNCPNKQSDSDPIPTWLLKECASVFVPAIANVVNFFLISCQFHHILKESIIASLHKKSTLDKHELSNYRQTCKTLKLAYYRNHSTDSNQILHSDKDQQMLFVSGPNTRKTNTRWRTAAILKNR